MEKGTVHQQLLRNNLAYNVKRCKVTEVQTVHSQKTAELDQQQVCLVQHPPLLC